MKYNVACLVAMTRGFEIFQMWKPRLIDLHQQEEFAMSNSRLQLSLSAKGLTNLAGMLNTSDPFAVVMVRGDSPDNPPVLVGQTEVYVLYYMLSPHNGDRGPPYPSLWLTLFSAVFTTA
jgi:hypothetical protein